MPNAGVFKVSVWEYYRGWESPEGKRRGASRKPGRSLVLNFLSRVFEAAMGNLSVIPALRRRQENGDFWPAWATQ